jgi:hypothetical protein
MGSCSSRDNRDERYMRPDPGTQQLVKQGTRASHAEAPMSKQAPRKKRSGGCMNLVSTAWTFDNFDLDLEGGDWRFTFASSRVMYNGAWLLVLRLIAAIAMSAYYGLTVSEYATFGLKVRAP